MKKKKREKDTNLLAKQVVGIATGERKDEKATIQDKGKNPHVLNLVDSVD